DRLPRRATHAAEVGHHRRSKHFAFIPTASSSAAIAPPSRQDRRSASRSHCLRHPHHHHLLILTSGPRRQTGTFSLRPLSRRRSARLASLRLKRCPCLIVF